MPEKKQKITCEKARNLCLLQILAKLGHFPKKESEKEAWFLSPFRSETQASFKVDLVSNRWMDFGEMKGGTTIDLVCRILSCSVHNALDYLTGNSVGISCIQPYTKSTKENSIQIEKVKTIQHAALLDYLKLRKITLKTARLYCKEIWYRCSEKSYFAIGLENHLSAWELRNKYRKNCNSPKTYTYLKRSKEQLVLIEGMFDLLSLAELAPNLLNNADIIVLNSIAFLKSIETHLKMYTAIHLYLDNDTAGRKATDHLMSSYNHIIDCSHLYKNYKDLNEFLNHGNEL